MEEEDIYGDLPTINLNNIDESLTNPTLECTELKKQIDTLTARLAEIENVNKKLEVNMASLLKTAKAEIARKDKTIQNLRRELDNAAFRRDNFARHINSSRNLQEQDVQIKLESYEQPIFTEEDEFEWDHTRQKEALCAASSTVFGERLKKRLMEEAEAEKNQKDQLAASNTVQTPVLSSTAPSASLVEEKQQMLTSSSTSIGKRINDDEIDSRNTKRPRVDEEDVKKEVDSEEQHESSQRSNSWHDSGSRKTDIHRREGFDKKNSRAEKRSGKDHDKRRENLCSESRGGKKDSGAMETRVFRKEEERRKERNGMHESKWDRRHGRYEKGERSGRYEKSEYYDRYNIDQRNERYGKDERNERYEKNLRAEKYERNEYDKYYEAVLRNDKCEKRESDRRIEKCERRERSSEPYERCELMNNVNFARERLDVARLTLNSYDKTKGRETHVDMHTNKRYRHEKYHLDDTRGKRNRNEKPHFERSGSSEKNVNLVKSEKRFSSERSESLDRNVNIRKIGKTFDCRRSESSERHVNFEKLDRNFSSGKKERLQENVNSEQRKQLRSEKNVDSARIEKKLFSKTRECLERNTTSEKVEKYRLGTCNPDISNSEQKEARNLINEKLTITAMEKHDRTVRDKNVESDKRRKPSPVNNSSVNQSAFNDVGDHIYNSENSKTIETNKSKSVDRNNEEDKNPGFNCKNYKDSDKNAHLTKNINYKRGDNITTETMNDMDIDETLLSEKRLKSTESALDINIDVAIDKAVQDTGQVIENTDAVRKLDALSNSNLSEKCSDKLSNQRVKSDTTVPLGATKIKDRDEHKCFIDSDTTRIVDISETLKNTDISVDRKDLSEKGQVLQSDSSLINNAPKIGHKSDTNNLSTIDKFNTCSDEEIIESIEEFIRTSRSDSEDTKMKQTSETITNDRQCTESAHENHRSKSRKEDDIQKNVGNFKLDTKSKKLNNSENLMITFGKDKENNNVYEEEHKEEKLNNSLKEENIERIEEFIQNYSLTNPKDTEQKIQSVEDDRKCGEESILKALSNSDVCIEMEVNCNLNDEKCQSNDNGSSRSKVLLHQIDHGNNHNSKKECSISTEKSASLINYNETKNILNNDTPNARIEKTDNLNVDEFSSLGNSLRKSHKDIDKENTSPNREKDAVRCYLRKVENGVADNIANNKSQQLLQVDSLDVINKGIETDESPTISNNVDTNNKIIEVDVETVRKDDITNDKSDVTVINVKDKTSTPAMNVENKAKTELRSEKEIPAKHENDTPHGSRNETIAAVKCENQGMKLAESKVTNDESANNSAGSNEIRRETEFATERLALNDNDTDISDYAVRREERVDSSVETMREKEKSVSEDLNMQEAKRKNVAHTKSSKPSKVSIHTNEELYDKTSIKRSSNEVCEVPAECKKLKRINNAETSNFIGSETNPRESKIKTSIICNSGTNNNDNIDKNDELMDTEIVKVGNLSADDYPPKNFSNCVKNDCQLSIDVKLKDCSVKSQPINNLLKNKETKLSANKGTIHCTTINNSSVNQQVDNLSVKTEIKESSITNESVNDFSITKHIIEPHPDNCVKIENFPFNNQQIANSSIIIEEIVNFSISADNGNTLAVHSHPVHTSSGKNEGVDNLSITNRQVANLATDNSVIVSLPIQHPQTQRLPTVEAQNGSFPCINQEIKISPISSAQKDDPRNRTLETANLPIKDRQANHCQSDNSKSQRVSSDTIQPDSSSTCNRQLANFHETAKGRNSQMSKQQPSMLSHRVQQLETTRVPTTNALPLHSMKSPSQISAVLVKIAESTNSLAPESTPKNSILQKSPYNKHLASHLPINNPLITSPLKKVELRTKVKKKTAVSVERRNDATRVPLSKDEKELLIIKAKRTVEIVSQDKIKQCTEMDSMHNGENIELRTQKEDIKLEKTNEMEVQKNSKLFNIPTATKELKNVDKSEELSKDAIELKTIEHVELNTNVRNEEPGSQTISSEHVQAATNVVDTEIDPASVSLDNSEKLDSSLDSSSADTSSSTDSSVTSNTSISSSESICACSSPKTSSSTESSTSTSSSDSVSTNSSLPKIVFANVVTKDLHAVPAENSVDDIRQDLCKTPGKVLQKVMGEDLRTRSQTILTDSTHEAPVEDYQKCSRKESGKSAALTIKNVTIEKLIVSIESKKVENICILEAPKKIGNDTRECISSINANDTLLQSESLKRTGGSSLNSSKLHNVDAASMDKINESLSKPNVTKIEPAASISSKLHQITDIHPNLTKSGKTVDLVSNLSTSKKISSCPSQHAKSTSIEDISSTSTKESNTDDLPSDSSVSHPVKSTKAEGFQSKCTSIKLINIKGLPPNLSSVNSNQTNVFPTKPSVRKADSSSLSNTEKLTIAPLPKARNSLPINSSYKSNSSHEREQSKVIVSVRRRKPVQLGDTNAGMTVIVNANNTLVNNSGSNASLESLLKPRACKMTRSYKNVFLK